MNMKKLLSLIGLLTVLGLQAQITVVSNNIAAGTAVFINRACVLESLVLTSTNASTVTLYDGSKTNIIGAYTNYTTFLTNKVTTYITTTGLTNTFTNQVLYTSVSLQAQTTNDNVIRAAAFVAANAVPFDVLPAPLSFSSNVTMVVSATGVNALATYRTP